MAPKTSPNGDKSPNLVTLLPPYLYRFPRHVLLKLNNCPETVLISRLNFAAAAEPIRFLKPKLLVHEALHEQIGRNCATWAKFEKSRAIFSEGLFTNRPKNITLG